MLSDIQLLHWTKEPYYHFNPFNMGVVGGKIFLQLFIAILIATRHYHHHNIYLLLHNMGQCIYRIFQFFYDSSKAADEGALYSTIFMRVHILCFEKKEKIAALLM